MAAPATTGHCVKCEEPASKYCQACTGGLDRYGKRVDKIRYCGATCQKADWEAHKGHCKQVRSYKMVYRTGELAKKLFFIYRERSYPYTILQTERKGNDIHVHIKPGIDLLIGEGLTFKGLPHSVTKDEDERTAILAQDGCLDAVMTAKGIIQLSLDGILKTIEEQMVNLIPQSRTVTSVDYKGSASARNLTHEILVIVLKAGERFVFDIAGAQYGWNDIVAPWEYYMHIRVKDCFEFQRSGLQETALYGDMKIQEQRGGVVNKVQYNVDLALLWLRPIVKTTFLVWLYEQGMTAPEMVLRSETDFRQRSKQLERSLFKAIKRFLKRAAKEGSIWEAARKAKTVEKLESRVKAWSEGVGKENLDKVLNLYISMDERRGYSLPRV